MIRNLIELRDGTEISSGAGAQYAIQSCTITESVNSGTELTLGSACCSCLEAMIITPGGGLNLTAGQVIKLHKVDDAGNKTRVGMFRLEQPTRKSEHSYQITAYDLMTNLDRDMTQWLKTFSNWGCTLVEFADEVCEACGLHLKNMDFPNNQFPVQQFFKSGVTGRQLMQWVAEIAGCFCRMDADAYVELAWYTDHGVTISATGDRYYFAGALTYEDYEVAAVDAVKLRMADSEDGALWPSGTADNPYIISGNPILMARIDEDLPAYLETIRLRLAALPKYRPCKVSLPASMDIQAGHTVRIVDKNGVEFTTCVMSKTQTGQRDTLECTGAAKRDSTTATNNKTQQQLAAEQRAYADSAAKSAVDAQTQQDIFNKLTKNGAIKGIYVQDGVWYINADFAKIVNLAADAIQTGTLDAGKVTIKNLAADTIGSGTLDASKVTIKNLEADDITSGTLDANDVEIINLAADSITAGKLKAKDEETYFDLDTGEFVSKSNCGDVAVVGGAIFLRDSSGAARIKVLRTDLGAAQVILCNTEGNRVGSLGASNDFYLSTMDADLNYIVERKLVWKTIGGVKVLAGEGGAIPTNEDNE